MRGLDDHTNRCTRCGDYGCYGTCSETPKATENDLDKEELEPLEGDSYDDARWADLMRWAEEEGGEA